MFRSVRNLLVAFTCGGVSLYAPGCVSTRVTGANKDSGEVHYPPDKDAGAPTDAGADEPPTGMTRVTAGAQKKIDESACATWSGSVPHTKSVLEFLVDTSSSMGVATASTGSLTKWQVARSAILKSLAQLPAATQAGALLFPNQATGSNEQPLDASACVKLSAMVPIAELGTSTSTQRQWLKATFNAAEPKGGTPTDDALAYALGSGVLPLRAKDTAAQVGVIMLTDGQPTLLNGCRGLGTDVAAVDCQPVIDRIAQAAAQGVRTYVIGAPGSERDPQTGSDVRAWLSRAATAGQSSPTGTCSESGSPRFCHYDLSQVPDFKASLEDTLQTISSQLLSCSFSLPPVPSGALLAANGINVIYATNNERSEDFLITSDTADCTEHGWYSDTAGNIVLCPEACALVQQNPDAELRITVACQSTVVN